MDHEYTLPGDTYLYRYPSTRIKYVLPFESYKIEWDPILQFTLLCNFDESDAVTQSNLKDN